jgi:hypothetical protein
MRTLTAVALSGALASLGAGAASAQGRAGARPLTRAQQLVNQTVAAHPELAGVELALVVGGVCRTVAATAPEDVGERCDADELGPMSTGAPDVELPSPSDPVYDITLALHDAAGRLIGAVGMDLRPTAGPDRAAVLAKARAILREMEAAIRSRSAILAPVGP